MSDQLSAIDHYEDLSLAVKDLLDHCSGQAMFAPGTRPLLEYTVPAGLLTVLSRIVNDGCTYQEAQNG